ncbi:MAG: hypothetical protein L0206_21450, partial [Actinobacteria bacterium]|nr:hypothetical protein [Actinomycetota bacterium]
GDDAVDMIAELRHDSLRVKIVALSTGWTMGDAEQRRRARRRGADIAVTKFVDPAALIATIEDLLTGSASEIGRPGPCRLG